MGSARGRGHLPAGSPSDSATPAAEKPQENLPVSDESKSHEIPTGSRAPFGGRLAMRGRGRDPHWRGGRGFGGRSILKPNKTWVRIENSESGEAKNERSSE